MQAAARDLLHNALWQDYKNSHQGFRFHFIFTVLQKTINAIWQECGYIMNG
jgi:hypothetical protein